MAAELKASEAGTKSPNAHRGRKKSPFQINLGLCQTSFMGPHLLQSVRRMLQHRFGVKLQKSFVDYENLTA